MGRSFVLRQPGGALAGYLMADRETLRLRASGIPAAGAELTLMDAHGARSRRQLPSIQQEQTLSGTGEEIAAAYAIGGGRVIFATDTQALQAAERALEERMRIQAHRDSARRAQPGREDTRSREDSAGQHSGRPAQDAAAEEQAAPASGEEGGRRDAVLPQRRWPPPPCLTGARYVGGRWVASIQGMSDTPGVPPRCDGT